MVAAAAAIGSDELAQMRGKGEIQGRRESEREWKRTGAARGDVPGHPGRREGEAGGGRARGRGRLWRGHAPAWRGGEDDRGGGGLGQLLGCAAGPAQELGRR